MGTTNFPYNFSNRGGIPLIESNTVTVNTDNVIITIPNRAFRGLNGKGVILFRLNREIPSGTTTTLPVVLSSNNITQPITNINGTAITVSQISGTGVYFIYYDKIANLMQLMTAIIPS